MFRHRPAVLPAALVALAAASCVPDIEAMQTQQHMEQAIEAEVAALRRRGLLVTAEDMTTAVRTIMMRGPGFHTALSHVVKLCLRIAETNEVVKLDEVDIAESVFDVHRRFVLKTGETREFVPRAYGEVAAALGKSVGEIAEAARAATTGPMEPFIGRPDGVDRSNPSRPLVFDLKTSSGLEMSLASLNKVLEPTVAAMRSFGESLERAGFKQRQVVKGSKCPPLSLHENKRQRLARRRQRRAK